MTSFMFNNDHLTNSMSHEQVLWVILIEATEHFIGGNIEVQCVSKDRERERERERERVENVGCV